METKYCPTCGAAVKFRKDEQGALVVVSGACKHLRQEVLAEGKTEWTIGG
jgi:hypothetical protein